MATPLLSRFADDGSVDDSTSLFAGKSAVTTPTLTVELSDSETEEFFVNSAEGAPNKGYAIIEDEIIAYTSRFGPYKILYLERGVNGTTPATHAVSTSVTFTPDYHIPAALIEAVIAMQEKLVEYETRIAALEP